MESADRNPARMIGFIMIGIAVVAVVAAAVIFGRVPSAILITNLGMAGVGIVFVAIGSGQDESGPEE